MVSKEPRHLFSEHWYRIRDLRPRLAANAQVNCHNNRGQYWYVMSLPGRNKRLRINQAAYAAIGRCDGSVTFDQIFRTLLSLDPESVPSQAELIELAGKLVDHGYLHCNDWPQLETFVDSQRKKVNRERRQRLNPMAPRLSLGNPNRGLSRFDRLGRFLFSNTGLVLWIMLVGAGLLTAINNWPGIVTYARQWMNTPSMWLISALCFPFIKFFHELSHGLAVRRWGGAGQ